MRQFSGRGGKLYAAGDPFAFAGLPLADCGDGFWWRSADPTLRCWLAEADFAFEVFDGDWQPVAPACVSAAAGEVQFGRCLTGMPVRASGVALPTSLLAEADGWVLEQQVFEEKALGMPPRVTLGRTVARLAAVWNDWWTLNPFRRVLALLPTAPGSALVGLGELGRDMNGLQVIFDQKGVTYAYG